MTIPGTYSFGAISVTWECSRCNKSHLHVFKFRQGETLACLPLPTGWTYYERDDQLVCPDHQIVLSIDGVVVERCDGAKKIIQHRHTDECLRYAAVTGKPHCIAECRDGNDNADSCI